MIQASRQAFYWLGMIGIYFLAWFIQDHILFNWDVSGLLHVTVKLLAGGRYNHEFFELNPPLILYLYTPPVLLAKLLALNLMQVFQVYVFSLATVSLWLCSQLARQIFVSSDKGAMQCFVLMSALVFLILPVNEFGQREHLLLLLTLPYLLLVCCRLQDRSVHSSWVILIGLMAGLGFGLKPYFLITFVLIELYYGLYSKKGFRGLLRLETLLISIFLWIYVVIVFFFHSEYLFQVLPRISSFYYAGMQVSWASAISYAPVLFCGLAGLFYLSQYRKNSYPVLSTVLCLAMLGYLTAYFIPHTLWYYHILPAYSLALLLMTLLLSSMRRQQFGNFDWVLLGLSYGVALVFVWKKVRVFWTLLIFQPGLFFCFFGVCLFLLFSLAGLKRPLLVALMVVLLGYYFANITEQTAWYAHQFVLTMMLIVLLACLWVGKKHRSKLLFLGIFGATLFIYPFYFTNFIYQNAQFTKQKSQSLIAFLQKNAAHQPVYFFSTVANSAYPIVDYAGAISVSRMGFLGWIPGLIRNSNLNDEQMKKNKQFFMDMVSDEISEGKPKLIFVDVREKKPYLQGVALDHLKFFLEDQNFKKVWVSYGYLTSLEERGLYKYDVYKRIVS